MTSETVMPGRAPHIPLTRIPRALPADTSYGVGLAHKVVHAIAPTQATTAVRDEWGGSNAMPVCAPGYLALVVPSWGEFGRRNPWLRQLGACSTCAWMVALRTGQVASELAVLRPTPGQWETQAWRPAMLALHVAEAILAAAEPDDRDDDDHATVQLLATVTDHRPALLIPLECAEGDCGHDEQAHCYREGTAACRTCGLFAGDWAGEMEGLSRLECTIAAPCEVLRALADHYGVSVAQAGGAA